MCWIKIFSSYWLWIRLCPWTPPQHLSTYAKRAWCPWWRQQNVQFSSVPTRHPLSVLEDGGHVLSAGRPPALAFQTGRRGRQKQQKLSPSFTLVVNTIQTAKREGSARPRAFWRKLAPQQSRHNAAAACSQRHTVRHDVCVSQGKPASTHSLRSPRLSLKYVLTSWGWMGTISLYELKPFVTV